MSYRAPVTEYQFLFDHVVGLDQVSATERFGEATRDVTAAILTEAGRMLSLIHISEPTRR